MRYAKIHVQAGVMASCANPADAVFLSVMLEQERRLVDFEKILHEREVSMKSQEERIRVLESKICELADEARADVDSGMEGGISKGGDP
jgi:hypothetical protein